MKRFNNRSVWLGVGAAGLVAAGSAHAQPQVTMGLGDFSSYAQELPGQTLPGGATWTPGGIIGVYSFTVSTISGGTIPGLSDGTTFWSTCLSPGGELDGNPHTYNYETFAQANPGVNPSSWVAGPGGQLYGIENANYLWNAFGSASTALHNPTYTPGSQAAIDAGAALAMAMYVSLYDSTGYGTYNNAAGANFVPTGLSTSVQNDLNNDLAVLNATGVENNLATGYMLVPTDPSGAGSGQEFIILAPPGSNLAAVPEPVSTSVYAGVIALLAVAGGTVRRKFLARA